MHKSLTMFIAALSLFFSFQVSAGLEIASYKIAEPSLTIDIPKNFTPLNERLLKLKYPSENRPTLVLSDESSKVNIGVSLKNMKLPPEKLTEYKDLIMQFMPNYHPSAEKVTLSDGREAWIIRFVSKAVDSDIQNNLLITTYDNKVLYITFNCTDDLWPKYREMSTTSLLSVKFNN